MTDRPGKRIPEPEIQRMLRELEAGTLFPQPPPITTPYIAGSLDDFLIFRNISCVDADDTVFEHYPELYVRKDVLHDVKGGQEINGHYRALVHCEENGLFLPSFALTCNIVALLYPEAVRKEVDGTYTTLDKDVKKVLDAYKNNEIGSSDTGWHAQNTVVNYGTEEIIHYPSAEDFRESRVINASHLRIPQKFAKVTLYTHRLVEALNDPAHLRYVRQLTGLVDPSIFVEIGNYFGKPAELSFPWDNQGGAHHNETRASWFGCGGISFDLIGGNDLGSPAAVRVVQEIRP